MSDYMADISNVYGLKNTTPKLKYGTTEDKTTLDMDDFLKLMTVSLQNQSIDSSMDTKDMMNQMVQMSVIQAISDISTLIEDTSTLNYAASLVGKEVTVGKWITNEKGGQELQETVGTITGTGTMDGQQVVFLDNDPDKCYQMNAIMAIGRLPENVEKVEDGKMNGQSAVPAADTQSRIPGTGGTLQTENPSAPPATGETNRENSGSPEVPRVEAPFETTPGE